MTKNMLINKFNRDINIAYPIGIAACVIGSICFSMSEVKEMKKTAKTPRAHQKAYKNLLAGNIVVSILAIVMLMSMIQSYKKSNEFATQTARKYIREIMKEDPEMRVFGKILSNQRALKCFATIISNSLRPSEQQRILDIINSVVPTILNGNNTADKAAVVNALTWAHAEIIKVIKEHVTQHPEFMSDVYSAIAYADITYVVPAQQHSR